MTIGVQPKSVSRLVIWTLGLAVLGAIVAGSDGIVFAKQTIHRGQIFGRDFVQFWAAAGLLSEGLAGQIYNFAEFNGFLREAINGDLAHHSFLYPPQSLLFVWPLGYLPYGWAYIVWVLAGVYCYLIAVGAPDWSGTRMLLAAVAPPALLTLEFGQTSLFMAALFIAGIRLLDRRPLVAGILFGLLTIKPHLGILIPIALIAGRYWLVILSATITTLLLIAASLAFWGPGLWDAYIHQGLPVAGAWLNESTGFHLSLMLSPFMGARQLGLDQTAAGIAQLAAILYGVTCVAWVFMKSRDADLRLVILATATFLISPYVLCYDLVVLSGALVFMFLRWSPETLSARQLLALFAWALPIANIAAGPWTAIIAPFVFVALIASLLIGERRSVYGH